MQGADRSRVLEILTGVVDPDHAGSGRQTVSEETGKLVGSTGNRQRPVGKTA